ncbi:C40 family peptidase [Streptomyces sp. NPDC002889]|uniref:C40 family peptidase n=1 Tax=Streptomyces sp. NPDC002889 TaxID=3364669 RepID=UPI00367A600E
MSGTASGTVLRTVCTVALAAVTVIAAVPASADPAPAVTAEPSGTSGRTGSTESAEPAESAESVGTTEHAGTTRPDAPTGSTIPTGPPDPTALTAGAPALTAVSGMLTRLKELYRRAEEAGEVYNAVEQALDKQRAETARLGRAFADARTAFADSRDAAGRLARQQYQGHSELSSYLRLLLARDPQRALDQGHLIERAASGRLAAMATLEAGAKRAHALATASRKALDRELVLATRQKKARDTATARLKAVEGMLASLSDGQLAALSDRERAETAEAQHKLMATGVLDGVRTPSEEGGAALDFAVQQIGKPYRSGTEGPESFDGSGLTSQAWAAAGRAIPRTSQEQWAELTRVPLRSLRPGDLVIYFPKATHAAVYLGDGMVIQAPRPGGRVKVSPVASNPLLGAVRPDPAGRALASYTPPVLPENATAGSDEGYEATEIEEKDEGDEARAEEE